MSVVAAYERVIASETRYRGGAHTDHARYKSTLCVDWDTTRGAYCPRGVRCDFAHGSLELRIPSGKLRGTGLNSVDVRVR